MNPHTPSPRAGAPSNRRRQHPLWWVAVVAAPAPKAARKPAAKPAAAPAASPAAAPARRRSAKPLQG